MAPTSKQAMQPLNALLSPACLLFGLSFIGLLFCFYSPRAALSPFRLSIVQQIEFSCRAAVAVECFILKARLKVCYTKQPQSNYCTVTAIKSGSAAAACATCGAALTSFNYDYSNRKARGAGGNAISRRSLPAAQRYSAENIKNERNGGKMANKCINGGAQQITNYALRTPRLAK